jgi:sterol 14-demethylase
MFANPDRYDPMRFSPDRSKGDSKLSLIRFGSSTHRSAGVNFAKLEIKIILAQMLQNYDIILLDKNPKPRAGVETKCPESPCRIRYSRRQNL